MSGGWKSVNTGGKAQASDSYAEYIQEKWSLFKSDSVAWLLSLDTNNFEKFLLEASEMGQAIRWRFKHGKSEN